MGQEHSERITARQVFNRSVGSLCSWFHLRKYHLVWTEQDTYFSCLLEREEKRISSVISFSKGSRPLMRWWSQEILPPSQADQISEFGSSLVALRGCLLSIPFLSTFCYTVLLNFNKEFWEPYYSGYIASHRVGSDQPIAGTLPILEKTGQRQCNYSLVRATWN